jgi:hypothetical protein
MNATEADIVNVEGEDAPQPLPGRPKTGAVLGLLAGTAMIFSYLIAYCLVNALVSAEVITPWKPGHDPRPWLLIGGFVVLTCIFLSIATLARWASRRQLSRIDEMEKAEEDPGF